MRGTEVDKGLKALEIGGAKRGIYLSRDIVELQLKGIGRVGS